jgi:hypothetical protein
MSLREILRDAADPGGVFGFKPAAIPLKERMDSNRTSGTPICTHMTVEFEDGKVLTAEGTDAFEIWQWLMAGQSMNYIHGARYQGPGFKETLRATPNPNDPTAR